jgi:uncharacterized membrane protein
MKRLVAALAAAVVAAAVAAPAMSSGSATTSPAAKRVQLQQEMVYGHADDGPCPFSSGSGTSADL